MADPTEKRLLTEDEIDKAAKMAGLGMTVTAIGKVLGVSKSTMERRMRDQEGVADAIQKGREQASAKVRATAFNMATSGKCPAMTIFWLKVREGWKESVDVNLIPKPTIIEKLDGTVLELGAKKSDEGEDD